MSRRSVVFHRSQLLARENVSAMSGGLNFATGTGYPLSMTMVPTPPLVFPPLCPVGGESVAVAEWAPMTATTVINVYNFGFPVPPAPPGCLTLLSSFSVSALPGMTGARIEHIASTSGGLVGGIVVDASGNSYVFTVNFAVNPPVLGTGPTLLHAVGSGFWNESITYDPANAVWWIAASSDGTTLPWHTAGRAWTWTPGSAPNVLPNGLGLRGGVSLAPDPNTPFPLVGSCPSGNCRRGVVLLEQTTTGIQAHRIGWDITAGTPTLDWSSMMIPVNAPAPQQGFVQGPINVDTDGNILCGVVDTTFVPMPCMGMPWGPGLVEIDRCGTFRRLSSPWTAVPVAFCAQFLAKGDGGVNWHTQKGYSLP